MPNANASLLILPARNLAAWMADVPDNTPLGDLCMPGTHETCALYGCKCFLVWCQVNLSLVVVEYTLPSDELRLPSIDEE